MKKPKNDAASANNIVVVSRFNDMNGKERTMTFEELISMLDGMDASKFTPEQKERLRERLKGRFSKDYKIVQVIAVQNANHGNVINVSPDSVASMLKLLAEMLEADESTELLKRLVREILKCTN